MRAIIIGGGIGGLACAIGLRRLGIETTVYERSPRLQEYGAGISIWANAIRALRIIGADTAIQPIAAPISRGEFLRWDGKLFLGYDAAQFEAKLKLPTTIWMTHRVELVEALAGRLPPEAIRFGHALVSVNAKPPRPTVTFENGVMDEADFVIGADGINSTVRAKLIGDGPPRYSGYTCWRAVCPFPHERIAAGYIAEVWGRGRRFGITRLSGERIYWWATENMPANKNVGRDWDYVRRGFANWASPMPELIEATPPTDVLRNDIVDRPPQRGWSRGRVLLIGDAAHPTTPNLGQGGCMALEDAAVLMRLVSCGGSLDNAFGRFEHERFPRTTAITRESRRLGWLGQLSGRISCAIRDSLFGLTSDTVAFNMMLKWAKFEVGEVNPLRSPNELTTPD